MPTYDYECEECGFEFETFHSILQEPLLDCPECRKPRLIRLIGGGAAVIVRGTKTPCRGDRKSTTQKDRLGEGKFKTEKPFWRDGPINKKVLKNPEQYIKKGKID